MPIRVKHRKGGQRGNVRVERSARRRRGGEATRSGHREHGIMTERSARWGQRGQDSVEGTWNQGSKIGTSELGRWGGYILRGDRTDGTDKT